MVAPLIGKSSSLLLITPNNLIPSFFKVVVTLLGTATPSLSVITVNVVSTYPGKLILKRYL